MYESPPRNDDQGQPGGPHVAPAEKLKKAVRETVEAVRDTRARVHRVMEDTRRLIKDAEGISQYSRARHERKAERAAADAVRPPLAVIDILLIEDSRADVDLFRHALKECEISCRLTVLTRRSEVEAFVGQAATAAPFSRPRLIIADYRIPGMEGEDIVAAVRTVPGCQGVSIVFFSSLEEAEGRRRAEECGAAAFVHKPGELHIYVTAVSAMVRRWGGWQTEGETEQRGDGVEEPKSLGV